MVFNVQHTERPLLHQLKMLVLSLELGSLQFEEACLTPMNNELLKNFKKNPQRDSVRPN